MLKLIEIGPPQDLLRQLQAWQDDVNERADYAAQVAKAKAAWDSHRSTHTMQHVATLLAQMCCGGRRCAYCEDSLADEVEHIWPKSLYPELVFDWRNYLYACGTCNRKKGARFAVYPAASGPWQCVSRKPGDPVSAPVPGAMVFINPRSEDPMQFFWLDLADTFRFVPLPSLSQRERERADYTCENLPLNEPPLCVERENEYGNYRARLRDYVAAKQNGAPRVVLDRHRAALLRLRHQTVWFEMKRQQEKLPELGVLFAQAPEALGWA